MRKLLFTLALLSTPALAGSISDSECKAIHATLNELIVKNLAVAKARERLVRYAFGMAVHSEGALASPAAEITALFDDTETDAAVLLPGIMAFRHVCPQ